MPIDPEIQRLLLAVFQPSGDMKPALRILAGLGVPPVTLGEDNMYYLRWDGSGANTHLYHREAGTWTGVC